MTLTWPFGGRRWLLASLSVGFIAALCSLPACGGSGSPGDNGNNNNDNNNNGDDGGHHSGDGGDGYGPVAACGGKASDSPADTLDFSNNVIASPSPPGGLDPQNAPQIVVFGWDDIESQAGVAFVNELLGSITNPNSNKGSCNFNPNACYGEGWSAPSGTYVCGDGTLGNAHADVTSNGFDMGNHTIDHLESNSTWTGIPDKYKDSATNSWKFTDDGLGPGVAMDQQTWQDILTANHQELTRLYSPPKIAGFRAPRLEVNDHGLNALKAMNYEYDENLEEIMPDGYVEAAIAVDTDSQKGFSWVPWPYTLDNGSPGIWNQQVSGDKKYVTDFPTGIWEVPVYQAYVPAKGGIGKNIANDMMAADKDCTFPAGTPADQQKHCYLSDGELKPGDSLKEVTAFDFNTFIYSRMTHDEWLATMKHTFLMRYYGNRAPLTYGAHPIEYTDPYDSSTLSTQANNFGFRNVLKYNTYTARQQAMKDFIAWIQQDPNFSKDTYFMSAQQLVDYMKAPFDKTGAKAAADAVAKPDSNGLFSRLSWSGDSATIKVVDGNTADITFTVASTDSAPVQVSAGVNTGALKGVSHIDIKYNSQVPFRVRLLTAGGVSTTVLLAGTGSERTARIRVKDFFPGPEASADDVAAAGIVNAAYMAKVNGIAFESAANSVTGAGTFTTHILQVTLHGVATSDLCSK